MTEETKELKAILKKRGVEIPKDATDDDIMDLYLDSEDATDAPTETFDEDAETPEVIDVPEGDAVSVTVTPSNEGLEEILKSADPSKGDKDPVVVEWCRQNLSEAEFAQRYAGRKIQ